MRLIFKVVIHRRVGVPLANLGPVQWAQLRPEALKVAFAGPNVTRHDPHLPFPSVCRVAHAGNTFQCVPAVWEY